MQGDLERSIITRSERHTVFGVIKFSPNICYLILQMAGHSHWIWSDVSFAPLQNLHESVTELQRDIWRSDDPCRSQDIYMTSVNQTKASRNFLFMFSCYTPLMKRSYGKMWWIAAFQVLTQLRQVQKLSIASLLCLPLWSFCHIFLAKTSAIIRPLFDCFIH